MSAERIKNAALLRFAAQGYDATSLAEIAGDAGIKTPSIYAHFSSKQDLFWQLVEYSFTMELNTIKEELQRPKPVRNAMKEYLYGSLDRFATAPHLQFWLRSIYLPPARLMENIRAYDNQFAAALNEIISSALRHPEYGLRNPELSHELLAAAFIGILRGIHAELLYCGRLDSTKILIALWTLFEHGLQEQKG